MDSRIVLEREIQKLIEARMRRTLEGIEETIQEIFKSQKISLEDLKETVQRLEKSFNLLSQKWSLQILFILFLRNAVGFGELKNILGVNSRTLSDKLKTLTESGYATRFVDSGPPLRVNYSLTKKGWDTVLLALPLLYYSSRDLV
jgi:DNA-binding HxlR family transcriptional regulator